MHGSETQDARTGMGMQGPECRMPVPSSLPCNEGSSQQGSPAAPGHRGPPDVLVKHPLGSLTPQTCVICFLWEQSRFLPPHLGSNPDGNSSRPPKRSGVRLGGEGDNGREKTRSPSNDPLPFPSSLEHPLPVPLSNFGSPWPGSACYELCHLGSPFAAWHLSRFPLLSGQRGLVQSFKLGGDLELQRQGARAGWQFADRLPRHSGRAIALQPALGGGAG